MAIGLDELRSLVSYDRMSGKVAGPTTKEAKRADGYRQIFVGGKCYLSHRLAWLSAYGMFPPHQIDHINGDRSDNRLVNLRAVDRFENHQNTLCSTNKCGFQGVERRRGKYVARIKISGGKQYRVGSFDTPYEAHLAYLKEKQKIHTFANVERIAQAFDSSIT